MDLLKDFSQKDMIEQIIILDEIKETKQVELLPELFNLYVNPLGDHAVNEMVYHTIFDLLAGQEQKIISGFTSSSKAVQILSVRRAADGGSETLKAALVKQLDGSEDNELISEIIRALAHFKDPALIDVFLSYIQHDDYAVVAWALKALARIHDPKARDVVMGVVSSSREAQEVSGGCELRTALAIENVAEFGDEQSVDFLIKYIHNSNPSFRRVVISALATMDEKVLPGLVACLESGDKDEKIMAANIIGWSGHKKGADILVSFLDEAEELNLKFAIYEALGRINSMRSIVGLTDGLDEKDELVLIAVVTGLDHLCNPGVVKMFNDVLVQGDDKSARILKTIVTSHARKLFAELYQAGQHAPKMIQAITASGDPEAMAVFRAELEGMTGEQAAQDAQRLSGATGAGSTKEKRILAADDSKAMLFFYKSVAADLGMELVTVEDGKQAFDFLKADDKFDLIISDMNMPNMDGIELTREIRKRSEWAGLPILMATTESENSQAELATKAGVNDFITKPFSKDDFKAKIAQMFG
ncbi:MAG: response regulator [Desulfobulbaceae bacterium]|nr:response regulator [Desulfobulbaceae bacterium]HIJ78096.1 response regulator [Deltaproteobacteria bacterium]